MLECIEIIFVYLGSKLPCVFIFNEVTWFFPSNIYLRESMNRAFHTQSDEMDMHECLSHTFFYNAVLYNFVFPFRSLLDKRKNKRVYLCDIVLLLGSFFLFFFGGFFPSMSQCFCSNDIVRIHHIFPLLVYIIFM